MRVSVPAVAPPPTTLKETPALCASLVDWTFIASELFCTANAQRSAGARLFMTAAAGLFICPTQRTKQGM